MPDDESKSVHLRVDLSVDLLGVKPVSDAIKVATEGSFRAAGAFLSRICLPVAEEFGLFLRDRVSHWRATQAARITQRAELKVSKFARGAVYAHPRVVFCVIDWGSWSDDDVIQDAWAGILASSCTDDGRDDSNVVFASLLSQMTGVQLRILNYAVNSSPKYASKSGLPYADQVTLSLSTLSEITGCSDTHRLDRELDHMRSLELISGFPGTGGLNMDDTNASIALTGLALHLYVRGQGFVGSPVDFFDLKARPHEDPTYTDAGKA